MNWSSKVSKHTNLGSENSEMMMKSHYDVIGQCYVIIVFLRFSAYSVKTVSKDSAEAIWSEKESNFDHYVITNLLRYYVKLRKYHFAHFKPSFRTKWNLLNPNLIFKIVLRNYFSYVILKKRYLSFRICFYSIFGFKLVMSDKEIFGFSSFSELFDFFEPYLGKLSFVDPLTWYWFWEKTFDSLFFFTSAILCCEFSACFSSESIIRWQVFKYWIQIIKNRENRKQALVLIWFERFDNDRNMSPNPIFCIIEHRLVIDS